MKELRDIDVTECKQITPHGIEQLKEDFHFRPFSVQTTRYQYLTFA